MYAMSTETNTVSILLVDHELKKFSLLYSWVNHSFGLVFIAQLNAEIGLSIIAKISAVFFATD